ESDGSERLAASWGVAEPARLCNDTGIGKGPGDVDSRAVREDDRLFAESGRESGANEQSCGADEPGVAVVREGALQVAAGAVQGSVRVVIGGAALGPAGAGVVCWRRGRQPPPSPREGRGRRPRGRPSEGRWANGGVKYLHLSGSARSLEILA